MKRLVSLAALALALPASAADYPPTPGEIVANAPKAEWSAIDPADLLVMDLAADRDGNPRRVVIQLMPLGFIGASPWLENIHALAATRWWDGASIYRVQDNYVVQWGDPSEDKPLPGGMTPIEDGSYAIFGEMCMTATAEGEIVPCLPEMDIQPMADPYFADGTSFRTGWPVGLTLDGPALTAWPLHCYGMVGVARGIEDTGTGADLYAVIGHAPRQLDRNIALAGRVIEGIEHFSSLPRGKGELGFYEDDEADKRVPIVSVRPGPEVSGLPGFEYLSTDSASFAAYVHARANRQDDFYTVPAGGVDICNVPVPIRRVAE